VLGQGDISVSVQVSANAFSGSAKEKIEAAGGTTTVL
jgi:large subunit ribosomal protein L15